MSAAFGPCRALTAVSPHIAGCPGPECRRLGRLRVEDRYQAGRWLLYELARAYPALTA